MKKTKTNGEPLHIILILVGLLLSSLGAQVLALRDAATPPPTAQSPINQQQQMMQTVTNSRSSG